MRTNRTYSPQLMRNPRFVPSILETVEENKENMALVTFWRMLDCIYVDKR